VLFFFFFPSQIGDDGYFLWCICGLQTRETSSGYQRCNEKQVIEREREGMHGRDTDKINEVNG
jgi:hypothetical protein